MADKSSTQYWKMTETPIARLIISLGIPTTVSMLVTSIYNVADTYFVSRIGTSASGAVGIVFGFMAILQAVGFMIGQGGGSILSRGLGSKDLEKANRITSVSFFSALFSGLLISILSCIFSKPLVYLLGSTNTIYPYAHTYIMCLLPAAPFVISSFGMNNFMRYEGRAVYAMIGLCTGAVVNIFGDWLLTVQIPLGVKGAGIATAVSQGISFCLLLFMYLSGKNECRIAWNDFVRGFKGDFPEIIRVGFPSFIRQGMTSMATMGLNNCAGNFGDVAVAAMAIVNRISFLLLSIGIGIGQGFQPVSAFNYGARKYLRVKQGFFCTGIIGEVVMISFMIPGLIFATDLIALFRNDPDVIAIGSKALIFQLAVIPFQPFQLASNMLFQSIGKSREAGILAALRNFVLFIPTLFIMSNMFGVIGIGLAQPIADILTFLIALPWALNFLRNISKND